MRRMIGMGVMIIILVALDQWTKGMIQQNFYHGETYPVIKGFFNLTYAKNTGAAFSFGANASDAFRISMFLVLPTIACFGFAYAIWSTRKKNMLMCTAYSLVLAGAIGNLIDRYMLKYVVDFFDFYIGEHHFAIFNVADSAISIAAFLIILDFFKQSNLKTEKQV
jgi:signal peptidase II